MAITRRSATMHDLERLLPLLDQQFIYDKNRQLSLALRFPSIFSPANCENIFLCEEQGVILSALALRHFDWYEDGQQWRGAMLGMVYTDPHRRGQGLASQLLDWSMQTLRQQQLDFAVLWTAQPDFYQRLGWTTGDRGLFAEIKNTSDRLRQTPKLIADAAIPQCIPIAKADLAQLEQIRNQQPGPKLKRHAQHYQHIPVPAESVNLIYAVTNQGEPAYMLMGTAGNSAIIYEMAGNHIHFSALYSYVYERHSHIMVNDCTGSPSQRWLSRHGQLQWQKKPLAMWLDLSGKLGMEQFSHWYLPYFDRI